MNWYIKINKNSLRFRTNPFDIIMRYNCAAVEGSYGKDKKRELIDVRHNFKLRKV